MKAVFGGQNPRSNLEEDRQDNRYANTEVIPVLDISFNLKCGIISCVKHFAAYPDIPLTFIDNKAASVLVTTTV